MRVGFIPYDDDIANPASRLRGFEVVRGLRALGVEAQVVAPQAAGGCDAIVLAKYALKSAPACLGLMTELQARGAKVIFDFADDLERVLGQALAGLRALPIRVRWPARLELRRQARALFHMLAQADHVTVSAGPLRGIAERRGAPCTVVPDVIAPEFFFAQKRHATHNPTVIVWTGYVHNVMYIELVEEALERLARRRDIEVRFITSRRRQQPYRGSKDNRQIVSCYRFPARFMEWRMDNCWSELFAGDIGIAPVPPGIIKSANKAATYMAMGLAVVASRTDDYVRAVEQPGAGYVCATSQEWEPALDELVSSPEARARMGAAGRAAAEEMFSMEAVARQWRDLFERVLDSS